MIAFIPSLKYRSLFQVGVPTLSCLSCSYIIQAFALIPFHFLTPNDLLLSWDYCKRKRERLNLILAVHAIKKFCAENWKLLTYWAFCPTYWLGHLFDPPRSRQTLPIPTSAYFMRISDPSVYLSPQVQFLKQRLCHCFFLVPKRKPESLVHRWFLSRILFHKWMNVDTDGWLGW